MGVIADASAEAAVLGALAIGGSAYMPALLDTGLRDEHFYWDPNGEAWAECVKAYDAGTPIDNVTVPALVRYSHAVPVLAHAPQYARQVREKARWRQREHAGRLLVQAAASEDERAVAEAEGLLIAPEDSKRVFTHARLVGLMDDRLGAERPPGWSIPFFKQRLRPGTVWLWGGWTSHGKTVWVDQVCRSLRDQGANVWAWLNEMSAEERLCRHAASVTGIDLERIEENSLTEYEKEQVAGAAGWVPWQIVECPGWTIEEICRDIRVRRPDVAVIDILHKVPYETERDLARVSRMLGDVAKLAGCAVMATVHLNRGRIMSAARPHPTLADIKGASAFEQDADVVGMVFREDDETTGRPTNVGQIYFLKVRQGKPVGVAVVFDGSRAVFEQAEEDW